MIYNFINGNRRIKTLRRSLLNGYFVVCGENDGAYLTKPPEIIFEILSPSTVFKDRNIKYKIYESQGVKYYIIVDLIDGSYQKIKDAQDVTITFDINECKIDFDFAGIW